MKRTQQRRQGNSRWNESHKRTPEGAQKVTGALARGPNRKAQKKPNQRKQRGRPAPRRSGEHGMEMARRRGRADKAAMRATRLLLVPAPGRVTTSASSPTQQQQQEQVLYVTSYARLGIFWLASHQTAPVLSAPSCSRPWSHAYRVTIVRVGFVGCWVC